MIRTSKKRQDPTPRKVVVASKKHRYNPLAEHLSRSSVTEPENKDKQDNQSADDTRILRTPMSVDQADDLLKTMKTCDENTFTRLVMKKGKLLDKIHRTSISS